jgi:hypothetical protein
MARSNVVVDISPSLAIFGILALLASLGVLVYIQQMKISAKKDVDKMLKSQEVNTNVIVKGGDDRYTRAPQPQRFWNNGPEWPVRGALVPEDGGRLVNIPTQGLPEAYQQMGILKSGDGKLLPLYGRRVASRSDRFNYYTRTDTYNPIQLPITYKKKDCQDPVGCQELFDGESVVMSPSGESATASLYRFDGPLYVPSIL